MNIVKHTCFIGALLAPFSAFALEIDQSQTVSSASIAANYYSPFGQSFTPTHNTLSQVTLKLTDTSTATAGSNAHLVIRASNISGPILGTSETIVLEDCFNFVEAPGCGLAGGYGKEIQFSFVNEVTIEPGVEHFIEFVVSGDPVGVSYAYNNEYIDGVMYKQGVAQNNDLWFKTSGQFNSNQSIMVSDGQSLLNYGLEGNLLSSVAIPANATNETRRDLIQLADGRVAVFNGTFQPVLSVLEGEVWTHHSFPGWSTANNLSYGGIATDQNFIYVTDGNTSGASEKGIVRFDINNGFNAERFLISNEYIDVTLGLDNRLYALRNTYGDLDIIDPATMQIVSSLDLGHTSSSRAATGDSSGNIYMASWNGNVYQYSNTGAQQKLVNLGSSLIDIDINEAGEILASDRSGNVFRLNEQLTILSSFSADTSSVFVAYSGPFSGGPVVEPTPVYCDAKGNNTNYEWIDSISFNGNVSTSGNNQGYLLDAQNTWNLNRGQINSLVLTPGFQYGAYTEKWSIWLDLNKDYQFDASEKLYTGSSNQALNVSLDLSAAALGETRMRISMAYGSYANACGSFTYGEVEDFTINISE